MFHRARSLLRSRAVAAVVAQMWQAAGSFGLQIIAAWALGAQGLGLLSLCYGIVILATAVVSGMVGDSLTVLDRHDRRVRAGLEFWAGVLVVAGMAGTGLALWLSGLLTGGQAVLFALALGAFQIEELVRRVFTARMSFWRLPIIDTCAVVLSMAVIVLTAWRTEITLGTFFLALLVGQIGGIVAGLVMMPADERLIVGLRGARVRSVAGFGAWRGLQVGIPPMILSVVRLIITAAVGAAALGQVEAARIFVAPATLAVQGLGSYLLASYVRDKQAPLAFLRRRAWRATLVMSSAAVLGGVVLVLLTPVLGPLVTGPQFRMDPLAVAGWALFVAGSASLQPFASLAAARGVPARVLAFRLCDAAVAIVAVWVILVPLGLSPSWVPYILAAGLFLGGILVRQFVLRPLLLHQPAISTDARLRSSYAT